MSTRWTTTGLVILAALAAASAATAQDRPDLDSERRAWLGFSYASEGAPVVRYVHPGSPAARAGLAVGDTVVTIDGRTASADDLAAMSAGLEPGDTVRLGVRRAGGERELSVVARPAPLLSIAAGDGRGRAIYVLPNDSVRSAVRVYLDSALASIDTVRLSRFDRPFRGFRIERSDSGTVIRSGDETILRFDPERRRNLIRLQGDTLLYQNRITPMVDSAGAMIRMHRDSAGTVIFDAWRSREPGDTAGWTGERRFLITSPRASDREWDVAVYRDVELGRRAVAGAELSEINDGLARYFGTGEGLLVLRVAPETPAARAGLEAGDVIVRAGGEPVASVQALRSIVGRRLRAEAELPLEVVREGERTTLRLAR